MNLLILWLFIFQLIIYVSFVNYPLLAYSQSFPVTIPTGATTTNMNEPFVPSTVNVPINSTVVWTNNDNNIHTVTSGLPGQGASGIFDSGILSRGATFEFTFNNTGSYPYHCSLHPFMRGSIIVRAEGVTNASLSTPTTIADNSNQTMTTTNMTQSTQGQDISLQESPIVLNAKKIDNSTYVWEINGTNNPTLNLLVGKEYSVVVKSIVGDLAEHELKVALPGGTGIEAEDFLESESVDQGEQTQVSFTPTGVGEFRYYCEYHPESMVGMLNVVNTDNSSISNLPFTPSNQGPFVSNEEDDGELNEDDDR